MKSLFSKLLLASSLVLLVACAGQGGAGPDGGNGSSGPVGGGQGQPTIAPGADHQPGIPVEDGSYKDTFAPAPQPTESPDVDEGHGPQDLKAP